VKRLTPDQIDDLIDQWHESDSHIELHEYLGWSVDDYRTWVSDPIFIPESQENES